MKRTQEYPRPGYKECSSTGGKEKGNIALRYHIIYCYYDWKHILEREGWREREKRHCWSKELAHLLIEEKTLMNCLQAGETEVTGATYVSQKVGELGTLMFKGRRWMY